jgi:RNA polymerase sigma factor (sigma-70 family)
VDQTNADFAGQAPLRQSASRSRADQAANELSAGQSLTDVFLAERDRLKRIVAGMGLSASDGEDALQDVSIQALQRRDILAGKAESVRWLIKVTVNRCLIEHRRLRSFRCHAGEVLKRREEIGTQSVRADGQAIAAEELEIVRETLQELDGSLLGPLVLRYFCALNSTEIGKILDLNQSTVRSRLREGRMILARQLMRRGIEP